MIDILGFLHSLSDTIIAFGYIGIFITIFAESGFLFGFFLPGDSLLFTLGILAAQGVFNIYYLIMLCIVGAILGDSFGYYIGNKIGSHIFVKEESLFFKKAYVERTQQYFIKYGKKTIILARFIPIVRTFAPIMAGVGKMEYKIFVTYNIIGGILWAGGILTIAYILGVQIPQIKEYLEYIIIGIIALSFIPVIVDVLKRR